MQSIWSRIMVPQRPDPLVDEPGNRLSIGGIVIESSQRPTMVVGRRLSGRSQSRIQVTLIAQGAELRRDRRSNAGGAV